VHPKAIPQLSDAMEVLTSIKKQEGVTYSALVPNVRGCQRALETDVQQLALFVSASETHNLKNVNMSVADSLKAFTEVATMAREAGRSLRGYIVTAFGCPYEGNIAWEQLTKIIETYLEMGVGEISLGDTTGMANPRQVKEIAKKISNENWPLDIAFHFHNSRGLGLANVWTAFEEGITIFDSSIGGVGGCPTAIGASGNVCTEDMINMFTESGVTTGIDFDTLLEASTLAQRVIGQVLPSYTLKHGRPQW
jgi:hydroxymethylglutaryl-CoA lyase